MLELVVTPVVCVEPVVCAEPFAMMVVLAVVLLHDPTSFLDFQTLPIRRHHHHRRRTPTLKKNWYSSSDPGVDVVMKMPYSYPQL